MNSKSEVRGKSETPAQPFSYGGQAVLEGVMMRGRRTMAVSVRRPDGEIQTEVRPLGGIYQSRIAKIPILRGVLLLWDTVGLGWQSLEFSAQVQGEKPIGKGEWILTVLASLVVLVGVFFLVPAAVGAWMESALRVSSIVGNAAEGVIRLVLLILYLVLVGRMPEIARVFAYHGAEHKTVHAYEAGVPLTPESVEAFSKEHPRCGTSFLVVIGILAIVLFAFAGPMPFLWRIITRLMGIPVLVAFGYEYLRLSARIKNPALARILAAPGVWTQSLTTRPPDRAMLEVAITALQAVRRVEEPPAEAPSAAETASETMPLSASEHEAVP
ncbi:MAG: DUF1385 domain-containing protein [Anaerolineales bacterium]|nr:DUF1385 domain-containing protein [Anaerolineales bacterium]